MLQRYRQLTEEIQKIYLQSSGVFGTFQKESKLSCLKGCGKCCLNPEVSASVLKMLPLALNLIDEGTAESIYKKLNSNLPIASFTLIKVQMEKKVSVALISSAQVFAAVLEQALELQDW